MRTGRKNRKKNRKSRGYIVPMCLALSGTLMAGTAAGAEQPLGEITNEYTGTPKSSDGLQWVKHNGDMVTLHNIGITNGGWDTESGHYYFSGVRADKKRITVEVDEDSNTGGVRPFSPIRSTQQGNSPYEILIKAKDFALSADFESNSSGDAKRYNTRGLFVDEQGSVTVEVSETINLKTGEFPIFADSGNITIRGFKELKAVTTGRTGSAGYVVRNVDTDSGPSTIQIVSTPDSKIQLISEKSSSVKETAVVEDASSGQGTLIQGGSISIVRESEEAHSIVMTAHSQDEGHIDIEGSDSVTIGSPNREKEFAVQGFSKADRFSTIDINKTSKGKVTINGSVAAESAKVNIYYAGKDSRQNGEVLAAKSHLDSENGFTLNGTGTQGTQSGIMNLFFSGEGAGMKGNMTAKEGSSITADFSGDNAFFNGDITAGGEKSSVTVNASGNAKLTGNVSVEDGGVSNVNLSGESLWTGKSALSGTEAASNVSVNDNSTWKVTADSAVSTLKLSGGTVDLEGGAHQIKIGYLSADGTPGTFRMDLMYHDNQLATYEAATDSDFLYVGGGTGQTFRVEAADNSSLNGMREGDKLYFARTASGAAAFNVDHEVLVRNWDKIYNKTFLVKTEPVTSEAAAGGNTGTADTSRSVAGDSTDTAASSGSAAGDSAATTASSRTVAGAKARMAAASMAVASSGKGAAASSETAATSSGEGTDASSEAGTSVTENTAASSETNEDAWYLTPELTPLDNGFTPNANAYVPGSAHNAAASIWRDNDTLLKRLGELRWSKNNDGAWGRVINRRLARSGTQAFDVSMNTLQLGYDRRIPLSFGDIFVGGAIEHSRGTEKYDDGDGSVYMTDGALYGTFKGRSGDYVDVVTKAGKLFTHYSSDFGDGGDFENWGFSASAEYGHKFDLGWSWSVEPQAQIKYSYLWGDDYTSDNGAKIYQDDMDSLVGRLGLLVAKEFGTGTENPVRIYAKGSVLHEFLGDRNETLYQDVAMHDSTDLAGTWYSAGVGANVGLSENCSLYVDAEEDFGTDIKVQYRIQGGFRFEF
ncbi:MAG: autotransporter outer membrane beta-barrel domain-containing protein [Desulfovibrio sp.]